MMGLNYYEDAGYPEWYDGQIIRELCVKEVADHFINTGRVGFQTKLEFTEFYIKENLHRLVNSGIEKAIEAINSEWEDHCVHSANLEFKF